MKELLALEENDCRFPMNDGGPYLFCAEVKQEGSSYCAKHRALCWEPTRKPLQRYYARGAAA